jgi:hypothetical protein
MFKKKMKNASKIAIVALGVMVSLTLSGCMKFKHVNHQSKSEVEALSELVFMDNIKNQSFFVELDSLHEAKPVGEIFFNSEKTSPNASWEEAGTACNAEQMTAIHITTVLPQYADKAGFQLRIEAADSEGCRKVYHRKSQLSID